jgi:hypothetical protein
MDDNNGRDHRKDNGVYSSRHDYCNTVKEITTVGIGIIGIGVLVMTDTGVIAMRATLIGVTIADLGMKVPIEVIQEDVHMGASH